MLTDRSNRIADFDSCMILPSPWNLAYLDDGSMVAGEFDPQTIDMAKRAIMENGAIATGYYADVAIPEDQTQETEFFSVKNWCQYVNRPMAGNHIVTIVGWDGTGYFYLSHYDMSVASLYSVTAADADPDTIIQQHDWVGVTESFLVSSMSTTEASAANVFTAEQDIPIESGVSQDYSASIDYTLYMDVMVNEGESLCFADGGWFDASEFNDDPNMTEDGMVTYGNFAIKVFGTPAQLQDAGDTFHGSTFSTVNQGEAMAALMDAADYDATTPRQPRLELRVGASGADRPRPRLRRAGRQRGRRSCGRPLFERGYLLREAALEDGEVADDGQGGIRGGIPAGDVTMGDILTVSPYGNSLATYELTGSQIADTSSPRRRPGAARARSANQARPLDGIHHHDVGRKPIQPVYIIEPRPAGRMVLRQDNMVVGQGAHIAAHGQMEALVVVFDGDQMAAHFHTGFELFADFADQSLFRSLSGLDFAAGKLPAALEFAISALRCQHAPVFHDDRCNHIDNLHDRSSTLGPRLRARHYSRKSNGSV